MDDNHRFKDAMDKLASNRVDYLSHANWESLFNDEAVLLRDMKLIVSYTLTLPDGMSPYAISGEDVNFLIRTRDSIKGVLSGVSIYTSNLGPTEFINIMDGIMCPSRSKKNPLRYNENEPLNKQCVDADTMFLWGAGASSIVHDDERFTILPFHVRQFPQVWAGYQSGELVGSFMENVRRIACPFLITLSVHVPNQTSEAGKVKKKQIRATQMANSTVSKYVPAWSDRKRDWDFATKKIEGENKMMEAFFQILLFVPEGKEGPCEEYLKTTYDSIGWKLSKSRYTPIHSFLGALPMGIDRDTRRALKIFGHYSKRLSWTCTNIAPWIGEYKGTLSPLMMLMGRKGQISFFDPFENEDGNFNIACSATSGGGKSFFTAEWIFRILGVSGKVFVIDAGHSYRWLCKILKGTYIDFSDVTPIFNPFSNLDPSDPRLLKDQIPLLKMLFCEMASPEKDLDQNYKSCLEMAIIKALNEKGSDADIDEVIRQLESDKDQHGNISEEAVFLKKSLFSYSSEGVYGEYFIGDSNVDMDNEFVLLNLDGLNSKPDLQSVILLILMMRITQEMYLTGDRSRKKLCIIDEAWRLLKNGNSGEFIEEGYRVARKYGGSFMTITQKISDYFKSPVSEACYMNSDFEIYLRSKSEELIKAEKKGYIDNSDGKIDILKSLKKVGSKYSELAIRTSNGLSVSRFYADPWTAKLYSTVAKEVDFILEQEKRGVSIFEAINMLLKKEYRRAS